MRVTRRRVVGWLVVVGAFVLGRYTVKESTCASTLEVSWQKAMAIQSGCRRLKDNVLCTYDGCFENPHIEEIDAERSWLAAHRPKFVRISHGPAYARTQWLSERHTSIQCFMHYLSD